MEYTLDAEVSGRQEEESRRRSCQKIAFTLVRNGSFIHILTVLGNRHAVAQGSDARRL